MCSESLMQFYDYCIACLGSSVVAFKIPGPSGGRAYLVNQTMLPTFDRILNYQLVDMSSSFHMTFKPLNASL